VIEFLVAVLAGYPYLKDISLSAHPLSFSCPGTPKKKKEPLNCAQVKSG
jgi:hypothetical protein